MIIAGLIMTLVAAVGIGALLYGAMSAGSDAGDLMMDPPADHTHGETVDARRDAYSAAQGYSSVALVIAALTFLGATVTLLVSGLGPVTVFALCVGVVGGAVAIRNLVQYGALATGVEMHARELHDQNATDLYPVAPQDH